MIRLHAVRKLAPGSLAQLQAFAVRHGIAGAARLCGVGFETLRTAQTGGTLKNETADRMETRLASLSSRAVA